MENQHLFFEPILEKAENYSQTTLKILKLKATSKIAEVASLLIIRIFLFIPLAVVFFLISIAASLYLGELTGNTYKGFLIVAGIYMLPVIYILIFRNNYLKKKIQNSIIQEILAYRREL